MQRPNSKVPNEPTGANFHAIWRHDNPVIQRHHIFANDVGLHQKFEIFLSRATNKGKLHREYIEGITARKVVKMRSKNKL